MPLLTVAAVCALVAGAAHVAFWIAESLAWKREGVWRTFGVRSEADARTLGTVMFNLGFYNLFLGLGAIVGGAVVLAGGGVVLLVFACAFMVGAAAVLVARTPGMWPGALVQGAVPAVARVAAAAA